MRRRCVVAWMLLAGSMGGCSVYPLPQDATGSSTLAIVANIRCQARRAVRQAFLTELRERLAGDRVTADFKGRELAELIDKDKISFANVRVSDFRGRARKALDYYGTTEVTYEFTITTNEENKQGASIDLLRKFARRADTIGISLTEDREREVGRIFTIQDSFLFLATGIKGADCEPKPGIDFVFPVKGRLPVEDLVNTYVSVNE